MDAFKLQLQIGLMFCFNYCCQTINRIQNKSFCLHNTCVSTVYIYFVYTKTHTYSIYLENIYMYVNVYIYSHIIF